MKLSREEIRLECLKLAASRTTDHNDAMGRAKSYFEYVTEAEAPSKTEVEKPKVKKPGTVKDLT